MYRPSYLLLYSWASSLLLNLNKIMFRAVVIAVEVRLSIAVFFHSLLEMGKAFTLKVIPDVPFLYRRVTWKMALK